MECRPILGENRSSLKGVSLKGCGIIWLFPAECLSFCRTHTFCTLLEIYFFNISFVTECLKSFFFSIRREDCLSFQVTRKHTNRAPPLYEQGLVDSSVPVTEPTTTNATETKQAVVHCHTLPREEVDVAQYEACILYWFYVVITSFSHAHALYVHYMH